jgi:phage virion morphogenesis protein
MSENGVGLHFRAGDGVLLRHLARLSVRTQFNNARRDIGDYLKSEVEDNIQGQKLFDGSPMPQSKAAIERKGKTLLKRANLLDSYVYQLARGGVEVGSNLAYARIHHFGGETGRPGHRFNMVARPVLGVGPEQERKIGNFLIAEVGGMLQ